MQGCIFTFYNIPGCLSVYPEIRFFRLKFRAIKRDFTPIYTRKLSDKNYFT